jgi:hypothetical protein
VGAAAAGCNVSSSASVRALVASNTSGKGPIIVSSAAWRAPMLLLLLLLLLQWQVQPHQAARLGTHQLMLLLVYRGMQ